MPFCVLKAGESLGGGDFRDRDFGGFRDSRGWSDGLWKLGRFHGAAGLLRGAWLPNPVRLFRGLSAMCFLVAFSHHPGDRPDHLALVDERPVAMLLSDSRWSVRCQIVAREHVAFGSVRCDHPRDLKFPPRIIRAVLEYRLRRFPHVRSECIAVRFDTRLKNRPGRNIHSRRALALQVEQGRVVQWFGRPRRIRCRDSYEDIAFPQSFDLLAKEL